MNIEKIAGIVPSDRQYNWQQLEFYAFIHFGVNTFTGREWGDGKEDPKIFNPVKFDADQWVDAIKAAGMRGLILTAKHHDGFCLWPSKYTEHSIKNSPYKDGRGDIVRETAKACAKGGIKFGVYLSPWDRHDARYGDSPVYNEYFVNQLTELLTEYGSIFDVWFDGACGEGPNGKRQVYDWAAYYKTIRELQPEAVISVCGPDIRWCGNEAGHCRESEWSVVPERMRDLEKIEAKSQKFDDSEFSKRITSSDEDLGSREAIKNDESLIWYPAEVNTSIRPGWFYHEHEDERVRSLDRLMNIYYKSVGGNSSFLLNIPPDKNGLFHENDVKRLKEIGDRIKSEFSHNLTEYIKSITASSEKSGFEITNALKSGSEHFTPDKYNDGECIEISISFTKEIQISRFVLMENIRIGQRIEEFEIYSNNELIYNGKTVGYKRIAILENPITTDNLEIKITKSRTEPTLSFIGIY